MLLEKEKNVLEYFSGHDVALSPRPFQKASRDLGLAEAELLGILQGLRKRGVIRNLRGVIDHRRAGFKRNALIAWRRTGAPKNKKDDFVEKVFVHDDRISHCYRRKPHAAFPYDIFTMMHARSAKEIRDFVRQTARKFHLAHEVLWTEQELKKERLALGELLA
jgi:siroheme decarboxylase